MERNIILVPTDFTSAADCALDHAIEIARLFIHKICLLHVDNKKLTTLQKEKVQKQLDKISIVTSKRTGLEVFNLIREGNIFEQINETANQLKAEFVIMGIHGKKGLQHIVGSYAYKVVSNSIVPVMVVKKKHIHLGYNNIVIPIDFSYESSQKLNLAIRFAKYFDSTIHVIGIIGSASSAMKIKKEALLKQVHDYVENGGVNAITEVLIKPGSNVEDEILDYSDKIDADLIMIVAEKSGPFTEFFRFNVAEQIIDRAEIPILTIIPNDVYNEEEDEDETLLSSFFDPLGIIDKPSNP